MSHLFKVGDKCRYVNNIYWLLGKECEIYALDCREGEFVGDRRVVISASYAIRFADGYECLALDGHIEPLNPPKQQETITWDEACFDRDGKYRQEIAA